MAVNPLPVAWLQVVHPTQKVACLLLTDAVSLCASKIPVNPGAMPFPPCAAHMGHLAGIAAELLPNNDQQLLAGRTVPARRVVVKAAVAHVQTLDDREPKRHAALDDPPAHALM